MLRFVRVWNPLCSYGHFRETCSSAGWTGGEVDEIGRMHRGGRRRQDGDESERQERTRKLGRKELKNGGEGWDRKGGVGEGDL